MKASILGIGTVTALGCGIETLLSGLEGTAQPNIVEHTVETAKGGIALPVYTSAAEGLDRFITRNKLRRIDRFLQMALLSSFHAIEDSGLNLEDRTRIGIVFGTGYGPLQTSFDFLDTLIDDGDKCASPTLFANSVHNSLVSNVSIALKLQGPCLTLTSFEMTSSSVFSTASAWLEEGKVDYVLTGVGDEYCEVRGYSTILSGSENVSAIKPSAFNDCTYLPGEGFVSFLMGKEKGRKAYGSISSIETGSGNPVKPDHSALFLAANGDRSTGCHYDNLQKGKDLTRLYSPLYGGMPAGQGFDVAIAALSLKDGRLYPSPEVSGAEQKQAEPQIREILHSDSIACLQYDDNGNFGLITLSGKD